MQMTAATETETASAT